MGSGNLSVRDFTDQIGIPDDEHMPPELGKIRAETDPHPLDSFRSYNFAHQIAASWLVDRGLRVVRDTLGARLRGNIVCSKYVIAKSPTE